MKQTARRYVKYGDEGVVIDADKTESFEGKLAMNFITRWGMISGNPDGEDSSGRAKSKLLTPEEVVQRAFDIAKLAVAEVEKRNLWLDIQDEEKKD